MIKHILLLILFMYFGTLFSQDSIEYKKYDFEKLGIGMSPSAVMNIFPALQFSVDARMMERVNFTGELGYIFNGSYSNSWTQGIRVKSGFQYLISRRHTSGTTMGLLLLYRYSKENHEYKDYHSDAGYYELKEYKRNRQLYGMMLSLGTMSQYTEKIIFEFGGAIGLGHLEIRDDDGLSRSTGWFGYNGTGEFSIPLFSININFRYMINR
ncbi:MAG: hypothetical protein R2771_11255 [Saprospiraceae bacterium]